MRNLSLRYTMVLLLALVGTETMADELTEQGVRNFLGHYEQMLATEDFGQVAPLIHSDAVFRFTEGDFTGDDIKVAFEKTWALEVEDVKFFLTNVQVKHVDQNSALATFNWNWHGATSGESFEVVGRGTSYIVLQDGEPKIMVEHLGR